MILHEPFRISSRLMPSLEIGKATISLQAGQRNREGRTCFECWLDLPDGSEHQIENLRSGCQGGGVQKGFESLLSFLGAAAEAYRYRMGTGGVRESESGNESLFSPPVVEWAYMHSDELAMLQIELEERKDLIQE